MWNVRRFDSISSRRIRPVDLALIVWVVTFLWWVLPVFWFETWTGRFALFMMPLPVGVVLWARLVRSRDLAALIAVALIAWAILCAFVSSAPLVSLKGVVGRNSSVLLMVAALALWAIGRHLDERRGRLVGDAIAVSAALMTPIATLQVVIGFETGPLATFAGRASGTLGNPVFYGAVLAGVGGYVVGRGHGALTNRWLVLLALAAYGVMISGSRVALGSLLAVVAFAAVRRGCSRARIVGFLAAGLAAGWSLSAFAGARDAIGRVGEAGSSGRFTLWGYALRSVGSDPLFGTGPALFREAVQGRFSVEFAREHTRLGIQPWADPHNVLVMAVVTTGVVGALLLLVFIAISARRSSGPLALFAAGVAVTWMLQPTTIETLPLAALALGAAQVDRVEVPSLSMSWLRSAPAYAGVLIALYVCLIDGLFARSARADDPDGMASVSVLFLGDPRVTAAVGRAYVEQLDPPDVEAGTGQVLDALELEPSAPALWIRLAEYQALADDWEQSEASLRRALELEPTSPLAWFNMGEVADRLGDEELAALARTRWCAVAPQCTP